MAGLTPHDAAAAMLAMSAMMATRKRTPVAARRCAKRLDRALARLDEDRIESLHGATVEMIEAAKALSQRACKMCGLCKDR